MVAKDKKGDSKQEVRKASEGSEEGGKEEKEKGKKSSHKTEFSSPTDAQILEGVNAPVGKERNQNVVLLHSHLSPALPTPHPSLPGTLRSR